MNLLIVLMMATDSVNDMNEVAARTLNKVSRVLDVPGEKCEAWLEMLGDFFYQPDSDRAKQLDSFEEDINETELEESPSVRGKVCIINRTIT